MRARLTVAIATCVAALAVLPSTAAAELKAIWGPNTLPNGHSAFPTYRKLGVDVLERQLTWNTVAPTKPAHAKDPNDPAYHWPADIAAALSAGRRYHFQLALMIKGTPPWADGGEPPGWAPLHPGDVARFAVAAARHYRHVRLWMVWGEPARPGNFTPFPPTVADGVESYARLLDRTYGALKSVRRSITVIGGMTFDGQQPAIQDYINWLRLPNHKPPRLDWFGHNPFGARYPDISAPTYSPVVRDMSDMDTFRREVRNPYVSIHRRPRLWLSEFDVQSNRASRAFSFHVSRHAQARWLTAAYRIAHAHSYIAGLGWFELLDQPGPDGLTGGLMTVSGKRKPAWYAYQRAP